jgi:hypothetical protein
MKEIINKPPKLGAAHKIKRCPYKMLPAREQPTEDANSTTDEQDAHGQQQNRLASNSSTNISNIAYNGSNNQLKLIKQGTHCSHFRSKRNLLSKKFYKID